MTETTNIPAEKLLPCPFCGGKACVARNNLSIHKTKYTYMIRCRSCGADGSAASSVAEAIVAWNRRVAEEPKWTKDNPKESGWYYCYCDAFTSVTIVRIVLDDNSLYASGISNETFTPLDFYRMYQQYNLRWLKIDIQVLPEEGETT